MRKCISIVMCMTVLLCSLFSVSATENDTVIVHDLEKN